MEVIDNQAEKDAIQSNTKEVDSFHINHSDLIHLNKQKISNIYQFIKTLGKGGMAEVKLAIHKQTGLQRAIKILNKNRLTVREIGQAIKEIRILTKLDSPNIAQIHEYFEDEKYIYVVEDYYSGGEIVEKVIRDGDEEGLSEAKCALIMKQVFQGLAHCHKNNVAYRDLKPENIMLTHDSYDNIKLVDFGLSYIYKPGEIMTEKVGTPYFVAPEVLRGGHTEMCDMWSAGVLLYLLLIGYPPFEGEHSKDIFAAIKKGYYNVTDPEWQDISNDAKDLIAQLLVMDPNKRLTAKQALKNKWIIKYSQKANCDQQIIQKSIDNFKSFRKRPKLQDAIYSFMVDNIISRQELLELQKAFQAIDEDGDGIISRNDLKKTYSQIILHEGQQLNNLDDDLFNGLDQNFGEQIKFSDWLKATVEQKKLMTKDNLEIAFKMFDTDNDGKISIQDIKNIFSCGKAYRNETWEQLIKEMDHNDHDYISHEDFINHMQEKIYDNKNIQIVTKGKSIQL